MNHPYFPNLQKKFNKKKILNHQQVSIQSYLSYLKQNAVIVSVVVVGLCLTLMLIVSQTGKSTDFLIGSISSVVFLFLPLGAVVIYWVKKKKYAYISGIKSTQTEAKQMQCAKVKLWVLWGKSEIGIMGVWLFSDTGEKYLYIYPHTCKDKKLLTLFPDSTVRQKIKATFENQYIRFFCYQGTDIIQGFVE